MDDAQLVARARVGDLESFGQLYDRYFHRVYDVAWRVVRDAGTAAAVTQEVFARVARDLASVPKSQTFASWLFTITHHAAVARAEGGGRTHTPAMHEEAFGSFDEPDPCRIENPALRPRDDELPLLIWEALTALGPRDYAVLDLHMRQGLDSADLAHVLGVSKGAAYTMVGRMKAAASEVITGYVVARRGSGDCAGLQQLLTSLNFPPYTGEARRAVGAHITSCGACQRTRAQIGVDVLEVFGAFAPVSAPMPLKSDTWRALSSAWSASAADFADAAAARAPRGESPYGPAGALAVPAAAGISLAGRGGAAGGSGGAGSRPPLGWSGAGASGEWDRNRIIWFTGAVAALLIVAFAGAALAFRLAGGGGDGTVAGGVSATRTSSSGRSPAAAGATPGVAVQTPTPDRTPSVTPQPSETATAAPPTPAPRPTDTPAPLPTIAVATATRAATATPRTPVLNPTQCPPGGCNLVPP